MWRSLVVLGTHTRSITLKLIYPVNTYLRSTHIVGVKVPDITERHAGTIRSAHWRPNSDIDPDGDEHPPVVDSPSSSCLLT